MKPAGGGNARKVVGDASAARTRVRADSGEWETIKELTR